MIETIILGLNLFGGKAIAVYIVIILAIVAFGIYSSRRGSAGRM